jgi:hypothetical protein
VLSVFDDALNPPFHRQSPAAEFGSIYVRAPDRNLIEIANYRSRLASPSLWSDRYVTLPRDDGRSDD